MTVAIVFVTGSMAIAFLLIFLGALLREPNGQRPVSALMLQVEEELPHAADEDKSRAISAGAAD